MCRVVHVDAALEIFFIVAWVKEHLQISEVQSPSWIWGGVRVGPLLLAARTLLKMFLLLVDLEVVGICVAKCFHWIDIENLLVNEDTDF